MEGPYGRLQLNEAPRDQIFYFGQGGELNAVRWNDWKVHFAIIEGNIATGERIVTNWPLIINLRADPYEVMWEEGEMGYLRWFADNMWLFVPVGEEIKKFLATIPGYPFQEGQSLNAGGINYTSLKAFNILKQLKKGGYIGH
jgi:arylsulfatase